MVLSPLFWTMTLLPFWSLSTPSITTTSPGETPLWISARSPSMVPTVTSVMATVFLSVIDDVNEGAVVAMLDGGDGDESDVLFHLDQELGVDELVGEKRVVVVRERWP